MYQIAEIYPSADIPDKYRKAFKLGNKQHQDSGVDGLIITNEGKSIAYQCKFRSGRVKPTYEELTKFWSDGRYCDYCCTVANSFAVVISLINTKKIFRFWQKTLILLIKNSSTNFTIS